MLPGLSRNTHPPKMSIGRWLAALCLLLACALPVSAQPQENPAAKTTVEVEVLTAAIGINPLQAQQWRTVLQEIGAIAQIRQPLTTDKIGVTEQKRGTLRTVKVIGRLNPDGTLSFPGKQFSPSDGPKLAAWLNELKVYGAQGSPDGQPRYGLSPEQYENLVRQLAAPVAQPTASLPMSDVLKLIPLPADLPLAFADPAVETRVRVNTRPFPEELQGLAAGTSLAFTLSQLRLGFRPLRTPAGGIHLVVEPLENLANAWPIGGTATEKVPRDALYPRLFEMVETGVENTALPAVLDGVEKRAEVRILIDRAACENRKLIVDDIAINLPVKRTAWALIVNASVVGSGLLLNYQQDEAGKGFLLVKPFEAPVQKAPEPPVRPLRP